MTTRIRRVSLISMAFLILGFCSCEGPIKNLADEATQKFNGMVNKAENQKDAESCIEYYKTMEMDIMKFKVKYGMDAPLARFYQGTSNSLVILQTKFNVRPEYGKVESFLKKLGED